VLVQADRGNLLGRRFQDESTESALAYPRDCGSGQLGTDALPLSIRRYTHSLEARDARSPAQYGCRYIRPSRLYAGDSDHAFSSVVRLDCHPEREVGVLNMIKIRRPWLRCGLGAPRRGRSIM